MGQLRFAARQAGASATTEPPTASLLGFTYSADQCAVLFPRKVNDITKASSTCCHQSLIRTFTMVTTELDLLTRSAPSDGKGLRVDLRLFDDHPGTSSELWLDVSCIHVTTKLARVDLGLQAEDRKTAATIRWTQKQKRLGQQSSGPSGGFGTAAGPSYCWSRVRGR